MSGRIRKKKAKPQFPTAKIKTGKTYTEKLDKIHYKLFIGFAVLYLLHAIFIEEKTIGHDDRYTWYIFAAPTVIGALLLVLYQWKFGGDFFSKRLNGFTELAVGFLLAVIAACMCSYLIFGNLANITWEYINKREANKRMPVAFYCPITRFDNGKHEAIEFTFNGEYESIRVSYKSIKPYLEVNPKDYELELIVRKGIWNYYVVKDWNIKTIKHD